MLAKKIKKTKKIFKKMKSLWNEENRQLILQRLHLYSEKMEDLLSKYFALIFKGVEFSGSIENEELNKDLRKTIKAPIKFGFIVISAVLVVFVLWGGIAPINSSAVAPGSITLEANRKTVQHLEGGIVSEILVKEGDFVVKNQPLVYLNSTSANAQQQLLLSQLITSVTTEARLVAERDNLDEISFPQEIYEYQDQNKIAELVNGQQGLFENRKAGLQGKTDILNEKISQYNKQIEGLIAQELEVKKQIGITAEQVHSAQTLFDKGFGQKPKLLDLKNTLSNLKGRLADLQAQTATTKGNISETEYQIINERNNFLKEVMDELKEVQQKISGYREQLQASKDVLERTVITAPQSGKITGLKVHTIGGVIGPGTQIMDIVPLDDKLIVEAYVQPQDIDVVHEGLKAKVLLTAYRSRISPRLDGKVIYVSADKFTNDKNGSQYFLAHVEIDVDSMRRFGKELSLYPGMPAEVFITIGSTTMLKYILRPLVESAQKSVRE